MKHRLPRVLLAVLLAVPLALAALVGLAWLALDAWLESAGGRRAIEDVLSAQSGYPVRLAGDFEVVLLPYTGVSGTDLRVGGAAGEEVLVSSARYAVSLALGPLLRRELNIDRLELGDVRLGANGPAGAGFAVPEIEINGFAVDRPADFRLDLGPYGEVRGEFTWRPAAGDVDLRLAWGGFLFPRLALAAHATYDAAGIWFDAIDLEAEGQRVTGRGCYRLDDGSGLQLDLRAGRLDLDALDIALPESEGAGDGLAVRARLGADEVVRGGVTARGVVINLGDDPDCRRPPG